MARKKEAPIDYDKMLEVVSIYSRLAISMQYQKSGRKGISFDGHFFNIVIN